ncbi:MAG: class I SAM-dependent rRNA methyltransferase [Bdellovibrionales bacterium]|nr:class I SAM-dependent rRNA methyltransferase [Bdellovibrionales bacterium]
MFCSAKESSQQSLVLKRNLRRDVLRGDPWLYKDSLVTPKGIRKSSLLKMYDSKKEFVAWVIFDPDSDIAARVLSTDKKKPTGELIQDRLEQALALRTSLMDRSHTNGFRLLNGEGDRLPGLVCDIYDHVAVLQCDGPGMEEFWNLSEVAQWIVTKAGVSSVVYKSRRNDVDSVVEMAGDSVSNEIEFLENDLKFPINLQKGQKTGFFLDQRDNRDYVRQLAREKSVLNLFSYTGGFSIYAGAGGASKVCSVDISKGALEMAERAWSLNQLPEQKHQILCVDIYPYLSENRELWDMVIVDPPSMAHSERLKATATEKYIDVFAKALKHVARCGDFFASSCSSHIGFSDFEEILRQAFGRARRTGRVVRISGQGGDHPFPHVNQNMRYLKFVHIRLDQ